VHAVGRVIFGVLSHYREQIVDRNTLALRKRGGDLVPVDDTFRFGI
jgi:hypothetical protein